MLAKMDGQDISEITGSLHSEGKMDEVRWAFNRISWTLYCDDAGLWVAFSSTSESHNTMDKENMESWLSERGLRAEEVEKLFRDVEKNGQAAVTVSRLHEPRD
jgi:hypothetical protein